MYKLFGKRLFDIIISSLLIVLFSPLFLLISGLVYWKLGRPILFKQQRPGLKGNIFVLRKFRTMRNSTDAAGNLLSDSERLTPFGRFLRSSSLDELPELWNVFKGEMSLVGPRPLLVEYLPIYSPQQMRRHDTKPGITGWAQINGRNAISWEEKFNYDIWYVDNVTLLLDIKILCTTVFKIFQRTGITQEGHATVEKFKGHN